MHYAPRTMHDFELRTTDFGLRTTTPVESGVRPVRGLASYTRQSKLWPLLEVIWTIPWSETSSQTAMEGKWGRPLSNRVLRSCLLPVRPAAEKCGFCKRRCGDLRIHTLRSGHFGAFHLGEPGASFDFAGVLCLSIDRACGDRFALLGSRLQDAASRRKPAYVLLLGAGHWSWVCARPFDARSVSLPRQCADLLALRRYRCDQPVHAGAFRGDRCGLAMVVARTAVSWPLGSAGRFVFPADFAIDSVSEPLYPA